MNVMDGQCEESVGCKRDVYGTGKNACVIEMNREQL